MQLVPGLTLVGLMVILTRVNVGNVNNFAAGPLYGVTIFSFTVAPMTNTSDTVDESECPLNSCDFSSTNRESMKRHMMSHKCPLASCTWIGTPSAMMAHWSKKHREEGSYRDAKKEMECKQNHSY